MGERDETLCSSPGTLGRGNGRPCLQSETLMSRHFPVMFPYRTQDQTYKKILRQQSIYNTPFGPP